MLPWNSQCSKKPYSLDISKPIKTDILILLNLIVCELLTIPILHFYSMLLNLHRNKLMGGGGGVNED